MPPMLSPDMKERSRAEAVATIYSRLLGTSIVNILNAALLVAVIVDRGDAPGALEWLGAIALISVARIYICRRYNADAERDRHSRYWARMAVAGSFTAGLLWGLGPVLPFSDFSTHLWFWAFVIGGMCAGATSLHAAHLPTAVAFTIPASLPLAIALLLQDTLQGYAAAIMAVAFILIMTFTSALFSREFARRQALSFALEARALELDEMNRRLSREIADHRSTSEALHQSQKMEALGNLTGGFAHDFNNILMVIIGNLDMLTARSRQAGIRDLARSAMSAAESGAQLLSSLLAFARRQPLEPRHIDISDAVGATRDLLLHAVDGSIRIDFSHDGGPATMSIDVPQFQAMLLNLVVNARDAMPRGGQIVIATATVEVDAAIARDHEASPGPFITISVRDTGEGMSSETLERAFEPFFTTKAARAGTGLGLSQVYGFARQSGGFGKIESICGQGTCVTIYIPSALTAPVIQIDAAALSGQSRRSCSLLLVDDNLAILRAVEQGLSDEGWEIASARDANGALEMIATRRFDIVVTDVDMPGELDGKSLAHQLRRAHPDLPILLMSGAVLPDDASGQDFPFIAKPFRKQALIEKVQTLIA